MAARPTVIVLLAGLLFLLLFVSAVAAAGGLASGGRGAGGLSGLPGHGSGDNGDTAMQAAVAGVSPSIGRGDSGGDVGPTDAGATDGLRTADRERTEAPTTAVDRTAFAGGRAYRGGTDVDESSTESGAPAGGTRAGVTHTTGRQYTPKVETTVPRGASAGTGGPARSGGPEPGTHHRGPAADPIPYAAPTRPADEPRGSGPGTQESPAGRGRKDGTQIPAPVPGGATTPDPILLFRFLFVLGFRRVRPGNVLEHPLRQALHGAIAADPGLDLSGCAAVTGANRETLRYHLALLVCCGKVREETRSGSVRFFPHDPALTPVRRALLHALRNESLAPMLREIRDAPGISRQELADRLGVAGPSVTRQVQRLIEEDLVESERCGRSTCYRLTPDCVFAFGPLPVPVPVNAGVIENVPA
jgi:DNA-binding transcriptional ArsR family regulator